MSFVVTAMIEDARYAFRQLWKNPGFTIVAVMTLALGIGAAAAMFGLIQGVLLSPPPYVEPDRLVLVSAARIDGQPYNQRPTTAQQVGWRAAASLETQALYRWTFNFLVLHDGSESLGGMIVTKDYFRVLGLKPILGRELADDEAGRPNAPPKALLLGYELWKRRFNSDPRVIGTTVRIGRFPAPLAVVGVMPPGVRFLPDPGNASEPNYDVNAHVDFWLAGVPDETRPQARGWNIVTRLRPGVTRDRAQMEVAELAARQARSDANLEGLTASVRPLLEELNQQGSRLLMPLFGAVALLFLVACGNVTGLLLARGLQRQQEYAMRSALGARRWRLFRQVLTESTLLAVVSAFAGAALAAALMTIMKGIAGDAVPRSDAVTVGWPVFASGFLAALIAAALAGLLPALRASLPDRFRTLEGGRSSASRGERRLLGAVATLQVVLTVALLAGAALLIRTTQNLARVRPGYDTENILAMTVTTMQQQEKWREFHAHALERVSALPGVTHTAFVWGLPLTGNKWPGEMEIIGQSGSSRLAERLNLPLRAVTPEYFAAMGIGLVDGRGFRSSDDNKAPRIAIVNRTFARRYFQDATPIGRRMRFTGDTDPTRSIEIVGVVADTKTEALSENAQPEVYFPFWQNGAFSKHLIVRATSDPSALASLVTRELRAIDPAAAVEQIKTMGDIRRESVASRTFAMQLLIGFSLAATLLALVGLYGVLSLSVGSRTKEMAVRKAIGAQQHTIVRLILGEGFRLIALGGVLGVVLAVLVGRALSALLFEVRAVDPMTLAGSAVAFAAVALIACTLPAWRAARTDLMEALRHE